MARAPLSPVNTSQVDLHRSQTMNAKQKKMRVRNEEGSQDPPSFRRNSQQRTHHDLTNRTKVSSGSHVHGFLPLNRRNWSLQSSQSSSTASSTAPSSTSTACTPASSRQQLDSRRIRSKYLYKLGVLPPPAPITKKNNAQHLGHADLCLCTSSNLSRQISSTKNSSTKLRFATQVEVHIIPSRVDFAQQGLKSDIWLSPKEMKAMEYRNSVEFATEQWNWRRAVDEHDFVPTIGSDGTTTWCHPAHHHGSDHRGSRSTVCNLSRTFCMIMSAQQQQQQ